MIDLSSIYTEDIPSYLFPYLETEEMQRLKGIDMNCGLNYTSFPLFKEIEGYSRYHHSLGVALIVDHFTQNQAMTLSGLFHDISTPAFSHVVDFMHHDYTKQESTEDLTEHFISNSIEISSLLKKDSIEVHAVSDYHQYPIADNNSPQLSADRLEYTCGDAVDYQMASYQEIKEIYDDISVTTNEEGIQELGFLNIDKAKRFAKIALACGHIYSGREDRYAMERLADLLRKAIKEGILTEKDLYISEEHVITLLKNSIYHSEWKAYSSLSKLMISDRMLNGTIQVIGKKRYIDPLVIHEGRLSKIDPCFHSEIEEFLSDPYEEWMKGDTY